MCFYIKIPLTPIPPLGGLWYSASVGYKKQVAALNLSLVQTLDIFAVSAASLKRSGRSEGLPERDI